MGSSGSSQWAFDRKGIITSSKEAVTEEQLMEVAVAAGAEDYTDEGAEWQILCEVGDIDAVAGALEEAGVTIGSSELGYVPKNKKPLSGREAEKALNLFEMLDDHDDCQNVYADFDISDEELARIMAKD